MPFCKRNFGGLAMPEAGACLSQSTWARYLSRVGLVGFRGGEEGFNNGGGLMHPACFGQCSRVDPSTCAECRLSGFCGQQTAARIAARRAAREDALDEARQADIDREQSNRELAGHLARSYGYPFRFIFEELEAQRYV